ncbi:MAG: ribosome silencing factor [bacterium]|nr:ribosome silencing factor [bacterium]MDO5314410.1 ribosome silencing factor [bacterium]
MTLEEQVKLVVQALEDKKAVDVKTYDVRGVSGLCDAFVVATGTAAPHLKGLVAGVQQAMRTAGESSFRLSGDPESGWIVVDYVDVVVHVFSPEARAYYALERLWDGAKPIP